MKKWYVLFAVVYLLIPAFGISDDNPILVPQWWNAPLEVIIDARDRLNRAIVDKGGGSATTSLIQNGANSSPVNIQQSISQQNNNLQDNTKVFGNVTVNAVGSETKSINHEIVGANFFYWKESDNSVSRFACIELVNTGNEMIYLKGCSFDFEDKNGRIIESKNRVSTAPDVIRPGERGYFYVSSINGGAFNSEVPYSDGYRLVANYSLQKAKKEYTPYVVAEANFSAADFFGKTYPSVSGRIINSGNKDDSMTYVVVVYKNSVGKVLFITGTNVMDVYAGAATSFTINTSFMTSPELVFSDIAWYEVYPGPPYYQY